MKNTCRTCGECREVMVRVVECANHNGALVPRLVRHVKGSRKETIEQQWCDPTHEGSHDALMCVGCLLSRAGVR